MNLRPRLRLAPLLALLGLLAACGQNPAPNSGPATHLEVRNQGFLNADIYVVTSGGARTRLGQVTGHSTETLTIPSHLIFGVTPLRFIADPVGASATPVSESISVTKGDTVILIIPAG